MRWRLKACPKCHGDVHLDRDLDGWYEECLQCSYRRELKDIAEFDRNSNLVQVAVKIEHKHEDWNSSGG